MSEEISRLAIMSVNDVPPIMRFSKDGEYVYYEDYEKLLAKYNGVFEWFARQPFVSDTGRSNFQEIAELFKKRYEESLK